MRGEKLAFGFLCIWGCGMKLLLIPLRCHCGVQLGYRSKPIAWAFDKVEGISQPLLQRYCY